MDKDRSIIAQSAGKDAAEITKALIGANIVDQTDAFEVYSGLKQQIFNDTLALAGAESVVEAFEGEQTPAPARRSSPAPARRPSGDGNGGAGGSAATLEVRSGKYAGQTLGDIYEDDPDYVVWLSENSKNTFLKNKASEFLNAA